MTTPQDRPTPDAHATAEKFLAEMGFHPTRTSITGDDSRLFQFLHGEIQVALDVYPNGVAVVMAQWKPGFDHVYEMSIDADQHHIAKILASYGAPWGEASEQTDDFIPRVMRERDAALARVAELEAAATPFAEFARVNDTDTMSRLRKESEVIATACGSWSHPARVTLGDFRKLKALLPE